MSFFSHCFGTRSTIASCASDWGSGLSAVGVILTFTGFVLGAFTDCAGLGCGSSNGDNPGISASPTTASSTDDSPVTPTILADRVLLFSGFVSLTLGITLSCISCYLSSRETRRVINAASPAANEVTPLMSLNGPFVDLPVNPPIGHRHEDLYSVHSVDSGNLVDSAPTEDRLAALTI